MIPAELVVLMTDMQMLQSTLQTAVNHFEAVDLADQFRRLDGRGRRSAITALAQGALEKVEAYLADPVEPEEDEESE